MNRWSWYKPVRSIRRVGRVAAALGVIPALVLSPLAAKAFLIHDHHGHDTHSHAISVHELDDVQHNTEHQHEEHEHSGSAPGYADGESSTLVILLGIPDGLVRGRISSGVIAEVAGSPSTNTVAFDTPPPDRSFTAPSLSLAQSLRACGRLKSILLTSNALLL